MATELIDASIAVPRSGMRGPRPLTHSHAEPRAVAVPRAGVRTEIQALRALAVTLVVVYHLWPSAIPGGFVGVDVFFAISGFLITSHLLREAQRHGRVSLAAFWARRARRILPAALLVLGLCAVATVLLVPQDRWAQFLREIAASATYRQNWQLASSSVDYLQSANAPSPVQHFWSLSAEEQFYLLWPLLIMAAVGMTRGAGERSRRTAIGAVLGLTTVLSLAYSLYATRANPAAAYFVTPTRVWEFGAGGLLALWLPQLRANVAVRSVVSWAGLGAIAVAAFAFSSATPFPGIAAALPVAGVLAVTTAGAPRSRWAPTAGFGVRPVQALGDVSYAVYLWHWPLLVFAPFVVGPGSPGIPVAVVALTLPAAALSKRLVEDPVRRSPRLHGARPRRTFACAVAATAIVFLAPVGAGAALRGQLQHDRDATARLIATHPACLGAAARDPRQRCTNPALRLTLAPTVLEAQNGENAPCETSERHGMVTVCGFGTPEADATATIGLLGDSHASHWRAALGVVTAQERWHGVSITRTGCAFTTRQKALAEPARTQCRQWNQQVPRWFAAHPQVHTLFLSAITGGRVRHAPGQSNFDAQVVGFRQAWATLPASVTKIIVLRDPPKARSATAACVGAAVKAHRPPGPACAVARAAALRADPQVAVARATTARATQVIDLTSQICDRRLCFPVVGGVLVYKDIHHLTAVFSTTLGPFIDRAL